MNYIKAIYFDFDNTHLMIKQLVRKSHHLAMGIMPVMYGLSRLKRLRDRL